MAVMGVDASTGVDSCGIFGDSSGGRDAGSVQ